MEVFLQKEPLAYTKAHASNIGPTFRSSFGLLSTWFLLTDLNLRVSHLDPVQYIGQVQVYEPPPRLLQVPPFRQGYEAQGSAAT